VGTGSTLMLFDQVTTTEGQAARLLTGAAMAGFLAAGFVRGRARTVQVVVAGIYLVGVLGFVIYCAL